MSIIEKIKEEIAINKEVVFTAKVFAGSSENSLKEASNGTMHIKVVAPAEDNKANRAVIKYLADQLGLRRYQVEIVKGKTTNLKTIKISR